MFGLEKLLSVPQIIVRDYQPKRVTLELSFAPKEGTICGIPVDDIPNAGIYLPANTAKSQAFLATLLDKWTTVPEIKGIFDGAVFQERERLYLGEITYETIGDELKIISIEEIHREDRIEDVKSEETFPSGKLPFEVDYVIPAEGDPYVEICVLTLHPEMRLKLGKLIEERINAGD